MDKERVSQDYAAEVLDTCLKAGRLMIEGGSETYRVEDTMVSVMPELLVQDVLRLQLEFL